MKFFVYGLIDDCGTIRYVGKTRNPSKRLREHINEAKRVKKNRHVLNWIRKLVKTNSQPGIIILGCYESEAKCFEEEKNFISYYRQVASDLCNICDGGSGGFTGQSHRPRSKAHCKAISLAKMGIGHPHTPHSRMAIGKANKGKKRSYEQRLHESNSRKIFTDEEAILIRKLRLSKTVDQIISILGKGSKGAIDRVIKNRYTHPRRIV